MSRNREQRVEDALSQLIDRLTPSCEGEEDDERFNTAFDLAKTTIGRQFSLETVPDVHHTSDLITRKLIRDNDTPEAALRYSNLFSRFLSKPVLSQKWGILNLLYHLSEPVSPEDARDASHSNPDAQINGFRDSPESRITQQRENQLFDEAFSRPGLSNLSGPQHSHPSPNRPQHLSLRSPVNEPRTRPNRSPHNDSENVQQHASRASPFKSFHAGTPVESNLLRDLPFTLQGVSSTNMTFQSSDVLKLPRALPPPLISLLHALAEPSLLYKNLTRFQESTEGGLVGQSFRAATAVEMRSYLGLVATLESQIRRALAVLEESSTRQAVSKAGVTLKRCVIWTRDATLGLRLMNSIVDESKTRRGGQIISLIHSFASSHGDPFIGSFAERLLSHTTRPFYDMLRLWIYDGELSDPHSEFFVADHHHPKDEDDLRGAATSVWEAKYRLESELIPTIITEDFAQKVFLIGKSLNFIRYGCGDSAWVENYSKESSRELRYGDTATLESSIDEAYKTTMARLIWLMNTKFKLLEHLIALKKYLLLGQGDFVGLLMESLASNLERPANSQYRHTLTAQLEHAIRNSNAQFDSPDVLRRLDARMLELSHGEIGWDVFTLEYKIDAPVDVIVSAWGSKQYLKVFNFLWRVKRVEFALGVTWRRCMTGARGVLAGVQAEPLGKDWKGARCMIAEMVHFVNQLQYYILFEVIESSWDTLIRNISRPGATLDDLIAAHTKYLRSITRKGLLSSGYSLDFTTQLHELLKIMLAYRDTVDGLYTYSLNESTKRQQQEARINVRTRQGKWGVTERDDDEYLNAGTKKDYSPMSSGESGLPPPLINIGAGEKAGDTLNALRHRLTTLSLDFRARVCGLLGDLAYQPDPDLRFLGVVMNFNDVYRVVRRSRRGKDGTDRDKRKDKERDRGSAITTRTERNADKSVGNVKEQENTT